VNSYLRYPHGTFESRVYEDRLFSEWLVGFTDGDGCFSICKCKYDPYLLTSLDTIGANFIPHSGRHTTYARYDKAIGIPKGPVYARHTPRCTPLAPKAYRIDILDNVSTHSVPPKGGIVHPQGVSSMYAKYGFASHVHTQYAPASLGRGGLKESIIPSPHPMGAADENMRICSTHDT